MKKIFQYIIMAAIALTVVSCSNDIEETTATISNDNIKFVVGDFPAFDDSQTRTIGTTDAGKTSWENGDELLVEMKNTSYGTQQATFTYDGKNWKLSSGEFAYKEGDPPYISHVYYAPNYKWGNNTLMLKDDKADGTDEYIEGTASITNNGTTIAVSFSSATRNYSRLRIATMANQDITVDVTGFTPASTSSSVSKSYSIHSDAKGNAYLYGSFAQNATGVVKYNDATLTSHTFTLATENKKSYALDATVISLVGMSAEDIKKKLDTSKTDINLLLASDADATVFQNINSALNNATQGSINLTLLGCNKIPSEGFKSWGMLKSIALPDVDEIEEKAFSCCSGLQKVVFGSLTKVYGNVGKNGIFEGCTTKSIDLFLSKDQKVMNGSDIGGKYCWTADNALPYSGCDYHNGREFLDYEFKSITCDYRVP